MQENKMNPQSLQAKQNYLHFEIIEKEYDPEEFQQFMSNQKGLNLDDYSMKELAEIVRKFQAIVDGTVNQKDDQQENINGHQGSGKIINEKDLQFNENILSQQQKLIPGTQKQNKEANLSNGQKKQYKIDFQSQGQTKKQQRKENQMGKKVGIDLKKMIIPQFKPSQDKSKKDQQNNKGQVTNNNVENKQIANLKKENISANNIKNISKVQNKNQHQFEHNRNSSKIYYQQDQDDFEKEHQFDQIFIGQNGFIEESKPNETKITKHRYNQAATESFYIPSSNTKLPFLISNKYITSSLFKEIKSFTRIDKDGKQRNEFFEGFSIKVNSFTKKQSNSIFRFPYITYHVETIFGIQKEAGSMKKIKDQLPKSRVWKVQRRFNDFKWLHDYMQKSYFGTPIPPIPAKTKMRSFDDEHLQQRMIVFERFLSKCIHIDEIASDPVFEAFLSTQSRQELEAVKKKFGDRLKNRDQNMMQFLKGQQVLECSKGINSISYSTKSFFMKSSELLSSLNSELVGLQQNLKLASQNSVSASNILRQLSQLYKSNHEYEVRGAAMFDVVSEYVGQLSYKLDNEAYSLKNYVGNCWMYEELYQKNILNYINSIDKHKSILETKFKDLHLGKPSELTTQQTNQSFASTAQSSGSANLKTTQLYKKTKQLYEINLSLAIQEITRHLQQDLLTLSKQFSHGISKYVQRLKEEMMVGVDLMTKVITVGEGKQLKEVELISKNLIKTKNQVKLT